MGNNKFFFFFSCTDVDPDAVSGAPFVRLSPLIPLKWYHKYQHFYIWVLYSVIMIRWYFADFYHYFANDFNGSKLYPPSKSEKILFWLGKLTYFCYTFLIPSILFGVGWGIVYYLTFAIAASYSFAFQFTVNHLTPEVYWPPSKTLQVEKDWAKLQIMTSSNYAEGSFIATLFSGGLNYQIEHHLFPTFCHVRYSEVCPIVKQTCKEFNVPHNSIPSYWDAISGHYYQLKALGNPLTKGK